MSLQKEGVKQPFKRIEPKAFILDVLATDSWFNPQSMFSTFLAERYLVCYNYFCGRNVQKFHYRSNFLDYLRQFVNLSQGSPVSSALVRQQKLKNKFTQTS